VSPIFRHGRLRLYLLKLLDEAPRHGYEVIRLLQDRFMGVYSPSPGTIYPRLARLEEDGLVTHDEVDGRKVYRITEKGREEIRARLDDLAELEEELTESVRDIAREVSEDVRDTVRSLREEITWAARDFRRGGEPGRAGGRAGRPDDEHDHGHDGEHEPEHDGHGEHDHDHDGHDDEHAGQTGTAAAADREDARSRARQDDAARIREEARRAREEIRDTFRAHRRGAGQGGSAGGDRQAGSPGGGRQADSPGGGRQGAGRSGAGAGSGRGAGRGARDDWGSWADRAAGWQAWGERQDRRGPAGRPGWAGLQDLAGGMPAGLERLASDFARELRSAAGHAGDIGEGTLGDLRDILSDTLARIRDEVFADDEPQPGRRGPAAEDVDAEAAGGEQAAAEAETEAGATGDAEPGGPDGTDGQAGSRRPRP
jgi:DNA-binding PadR family transcriptional regulator